MHTFLLEQIPPCVNLDGLKVPCNLPFTQVSLTQLHIHTDESKPKEMKRTPQQKRSTNRAIGTKKG